MKLRTALICLVLVGAAQLSAAANTLPIDPGLRDKQPFVHSYLGPTSLGRVITKTMQSFDVPGMAVGILHQGQMVHLQGYGIRELGKSGKIQADTVFKVASNSKAFTAAAFAILIDAGKLTWHSKVKDLLPGFQMRDPWLSAHLTLADLLTHRTGLKQGTGDLMLWPEPNLFSRRDVIYALRFFVAAKPFRSEYAYDNLLYIVAGEIIPQLTGLQWNEFIDQRIMAPLGLKHCSAGAISAAMANNLAAPHGVIEGKLQVIERARITDNISLMAAAGGVRCSAADMLVWIETQLNMGMMPAGERLYSKTQATEMWRPQVTRAVSEKDLVMHRTHFKAYGLGWRLADVYGYKQISHTGSLAGTRSFVTLVPELELGVVVLTNGSSSAARSIVMNTIVRSYMHDKPVDWFQLAVDNRGKKLSKGASTASRRLSKSVTDAVRKRLLEYSGAYVDPWFGQVNISPDKTPARQETRAGFIFQAVKSPQLRGELRFIKTDMLSVHWFDRTLEADAYVRFHRDAHNQITEMTMEAISPATDFSFDFPDLRFKKVDQ